MKGFHHSDSNLPAVENEISTEALFGAKANSAVHPQQLESVEVPAPGGARVFHDEAMENEKEMDISSGENPFDRPSFEGMGKHSGAPEPLPALGELHFDFEGEALPVRLEEPDPGLVFAEEGMD